MFALASNVFAVDSAEYGSVCGALVLPLICLAGTAKCLHIMRRPTTSKLCAMSLAFALAALAFVGFVTAIVEDAWPLARPSVHELLSRCLVTLTATGLVLGIVGLVDYSRRKDELQRGRGMAVSGTALNALMLAWMIGPPTVRAVVEDLPSVTVASTPNEWIEFKNLNFRLQMPERPWVRIDIKKVQPEAIVGLTRGKPRVFFAVSAADLGVKIDHEADLLSVCVEGAKTKLKFNAVSVQVGEGKPEMVNGVDGVRFLRKCFKSHLPWA